MRRYGIITREERDVVEIKCSVCKRDLLNDKMERQEAMHFHNYCGYGSVFGDGTEVYIDLCQHCFKELLGKYCTII